MADAGIVRADCGGRRFVTRSAYLRWVILSTVAVALLSACDGWYFRRIDVANPDTAGFALGSPPTQAVLATLRDYAAQAHLHCPSGNEFPFECSRTPIRIWVQQSEHGLVVCYYALGAAFERRKFEHRMDQLQSMLSERLGERSVTSIPYD